MEKLKTNEDGKIYSGQKKKGTEKEMFSAIFFIVVFIK